MTCIDKYVTCTDKGWCKKKVVLLGGAHHKLDYVTCIDKYMTSIDRCVTSIDKCMTSIDNFLDFYSRKD